MMYTYLRAMVNNFIQSIIFTFGKVTNEGNAELKAQTGGFFNWISQ